MGKFLLMTHQQPPLWADRSVMSLALVCRLLGRESAGVFRWENGVWRMGKEPEQKARDKVKAIALKDFSCRSF